MPEVEYSNFIERKLQPPKTIKEVVNLNKDLWESQSQPDFEANLERWTNSIHSRLDALRGDKTLSPHISIIIPAYNEERAILQTLESMARQGGVENVEVIVVVNNSNDRTAELARKAGTEVIEYSGQEVKGVARARQRGLERAKGKIVVSTDGDIVVSPGWLKSLIAPLEKDQNIFGTTGYLHHHDRLQVAPFLQFWDGYRNKN